MKPIFFSNSKSFRTWLTKNHAKKTELLVGFYKVGTGKSSMTWSESVDQALCFGWIDGVRKSMDDERYTIRFTPRKPTSIWSDINIKKITALRKKGLMTAAGEKAFSLRKENKSGVYSHENETQDLSAELKKIFKANKKSWNFFMEQAPSYKKRIIHWIMSAKLAPTKLTRLQKTISMSANEKRVP